VWEEAKFVSFAGAGDATTCARLGKGLIRARLGWRKRRSIHYVGFSAPIRGPSVLVEPPQSPI
jgi:hypothetical protein